MKVASVSDPLLMMICVSSLGSLSVSSDELSGFIRNLSGSISTGSSSGNDAAETIGLKVDPSSEKVWLIDETVSGEMFVVGVAKTFESSINFDVGTGRGRIIPEKRNLN